MMQQINLMPLEVYWNESREGESTKYWTCKMESWTHKNQPRSASVVQACRRGGRLIS